MHQRGVEHFVRSQAVFGQGVQRHVRRAEGQHEYLIGDSDCAVLVIRCRGEQRVAVGVGAVGVFDLPGVFKEGLRCRCGPRAVGDPGNQEKTHFFFRRDSPDCRREEPDPDGVPQPGPHGFCKARAERLHGRHVQCIP